MLNKTNIIIENIKIKYVLYKHLNRFVTTINIFNPPISFFKT